MIYLKVVVVHFLSTGIVTLDLNLIYLQSVHAYLHPSAFVTEYGVIPLDMSKPEIMYHDDLQNLINDCTLLTK